MGKQSDDPTQVVNRSSIVLLQERFRQLQKAKKRREERELPKVLLETADMITPARSLDQRESTSQEYSSLSLGLHLQTDQQAEYLSDDMKTQSSPNLWLNNIGNSSTSKHFGSTTSSEIDTSLHL